MCTNKRFMKKSEVKLGFFRIILPKENYSHLSCNAHFTEITLAKIHNC